jgi:hypothetical protein
MRIAAISPQRARTRKAARNRAAMHSAARAMAQTRAQPRAGISPQGLRDRCVLRRHGRAFFQD